MSPMRYAIKAVVEALSVFCLRVISNWFSFAECQIPHCFEPPLQRGLTEELTDYWQSETGRNSCNNLYLLFCVSIIHFIFCILCFARNMDIRFA